MLLQYKLKPLKFETYTHLTDRVKYTYSETVCILYYSK